MIRRIPAAGGRVRRIAREAPLTLSRDWSVWAAENLLAGAPSAQVRDGLVARGVPPALASQHLDAIARSPAYAAARRFVAHTRRFDLLTRLYADLARTAGAPSDVERVASLDAEAFFTRYYATNTPVVLTDVVSKWPAASRWTPQYFKQHYGDVAVRAAFGRDADPDYDMHTSQISREVRLGDFIDAVLAAGESNDLYLVANNRNMDNPALRSLYEDISVDPDVLDASSYARSVALWIGPAGTVTPLHHDTSNILFAQVYGRKRFKLVAPWEPSLFGALRGVYSAIDAERPDLAAHPGYAHAVVKDVTLAPGEMLFIPVGWWHHVRALSLSINIAFTNFTRDNSFDWFRPGEVHRGLG